MGTPPTFYFATTMAALAIVLGVVLTAFLVNHFAPRKRKHIRRTVLLALVYLAAYGASVTLSALHQDPGAHLAREGAEFFGAIALVSLVGLTVFDLGLPAIGVDVATIAVDLIVGASYIVTAFLTLHRAGFNVSGILATSALLTTITAFSLQGTLSNVVGGVALQLDDSIKVGDWIQLENGRQGRVREVRWRYTVIETRDWDTLIVPNATLLGGTITILGKRDGAPLQHRMWVYFNVDFRYSPAEVIQTVDDALQSAPIEGVALTPKPHCICSDFAKDRRDSFAHYAVRYWLTDIARDDPTSSLMRERIYTALKRAQIPLAMPAATVWVEQDDAEHRARKQQRELERRLKALSGVEFLKLLRQDELAAIAQRLRYAPFAPGEPMTKQGAVAHWLYVVLDGVAEVRVTVEGSERVVAKIEAPGFFGEMGLMTGEPRTATVVALTEVECYRLDKEAFQRIMQERPEIAREISSLLASRSVELTAIREHMDAAAKERCRAAEETRLLRTIQRFFGLMGHDEAA